MTDTSIGFVGGGQRGNWIRLRTVIWLRWVAIAGQIGALLVARFYYDLKLESALFYLVIGLAVIANLVAMFIFPESKRLTERENLLMVLFDLLQLSALLYLSGGLNNPFALLIVGPVTVSAAALSLRSTVFLGAMAILIVSLLAEFHMPLRTSAGTVLWVGELFVFGNWVAIVIAVVFLSVYARWISSEAHSMSDALQATQMALAREQKLSDLSGIVAAAAHELGTPLATIKLASSELMEDLSDHPDVLEDVTLINQETDRCRDILRSMGQIGKDDLYMRHAPVTAVVDEAAEPHVDRGKALHFETMSHLGTELPQPVIARRPEIVHGLRNLIQNAVDFARENVWVETTWSHGKITIRIQDDGPGFPAHLIGRIGDPFMRSGKKSATDGASRPAYEGMGLGLFIAKTLLERTGAELTFANGSDLQNADTVASARCGAIVAVTWPFAKIDARFGGDAMPIGQNRPLEV
ncbi:ActS/PrrB/RegB family redox-sensitive histidine kinase [Alisedimentitalea sp. MJ-SS2]|uniref:sensor histidine kinase RegB n=1 Tax=Aliisedimentitalea sp. MJ-SS2 TaxID=3049795 RepID=UPI0029158CCA|nr:ActS/PrrB/RegB family redox-sensitive histidine kinase [Alisedimentitalea sp. MJ-SS2]MDU8927945.1 ActS/PrrB/RegB family redox-sensitive histidine kinase [Alisedimentitalea sp. MJ-SS2]